MLKIMMSLLAADMAKLADALASGASESNLMQVQVLLSAFLFREISIMPARFYFAGIIAVYF